jgi:hypothetical protein
VGHRPGGPGWNTTQSQQITVRVEGAVDAGGREAAGVAGGLYFAAKGAGLCAPGDAIAAGTCAVVGGVVGGIFGEATFDAAYDAAEDGVNAYFYGLRIVWRC